MVHPRTFSCRSEGRFCKQSLPSRSTLRWAHDAGLSNVSDSNNSWQQQVKAYSAGLYADQDTLALAHELFGGLLEVDFLVFGAAASDCCTKMNWLCTQRLQPLPRKVTWYAARSGSLDMVKLDHRPDQMLTDEGGVLTNSIR
jgi:hypothetical protein